VPGRAARCSFRNANAWKSTGCRGKIGDRGDLPVQRLPLDARQAVGLVPEEDPGISGRTGETQLARRVQQRKVRRKSVAIRKAKMLEPSEGRQVIGKYLDRLLVGHAADVMAGMPEASVDLVITSPPYWTAVEYDGGKSPWESYAAYLTHMQSVWGECARVLRPNGKTCESYKLPGIRRSRMYNTINLDRIAQRLAPSIYSRRILRKMNTSSSSLRRARAQTRSTDSVRGIWVGSEKIWPRRKARKFTE
jgi:hypothetical protein